MLTALTDLVWVFAGCLAIVTVTAVVLIIVMWIKGVWK